MRIISGLFKGKRLFLHKNVKIRPTSDFVKEAMFQLISNYLQSIDKDWKDVAVLDLFCGTGALGIEAISRGARQVVFVDCDNVVLKNTIKNLENLNLNGINVIKFNIGKDIDFKGRLSKNCSICKFDLILADPPYNMDFTNSIFDLVTREDLLTHAGILVLQCHKKTIIPEFFPYNRDFELRLFDRRVYGITMLGFYGILERQRN